MIIERDRYLDDTGDWPLTLALRSRNAGMHSLLSALTPSEADRIGAVLARALDEIVAILRDARAEQAASR